MNFNSRVFVLAVCTASSADIAEPPAAGKVVDPPYSRILRLSFVDMRCTAMGNSTCPICRRKRSAPTWTPWPSGTLADLPSSRAEAHYRTARGLSEGDGAQAVERGRGLPERRILQILPDGLGGGPEERHGSDSVRHMGLPHGMVDGQLYAKYPQYIAKSLEMAETNVTGPAKAELTIPGNLYVGAVMMNRDTSSWWTSAHRAGPEAAGGAGPKGNWKVMVFYLDATIRRPRRKGPSSTIWTRPLWTRSSL